jgi:hypothetical protein
MSRSFSGRTHHILAIVFDQMANLERVQSGLRANVGNGAAKPNVVAYEIDTVRVLEQLIDVGLPNAKASVEVATVVRFLTISHVPCSHLESGAARSRSPMESGK